MNKKLVYFKPSVEIEAFSVEDVITASSPVGSDEDYHGGSSESVTFGQWFLD